MQYQKDTPMNAYNNVLRSNSYCITFWTCCESMLKSSSMRNLPFVHKGKPFGNCCQVDVMERKTALSCFITNFDNGSYECLFLSPNACDMIWEIRSSKEYVEPEVAVKYISLEGLHILHQMMQIRWQETINVIARVVAWLIDGWSPLIKSLWQIMYFFVTGKWAKVQPSWEESTQTSWCNIDCAICDVCDFKATITLSVLKTDTCSC